jgi:hypothetical protein
VDEAEREDVERDRNYLHDRLDDRVDHAEDHRDDEDYADLLQRCVCTDEADSGNNQRDYPQCEPRQRGAQQKRHHAADPATASDAQSAARSR